MDWAQSTKTTDMEEVRETLKANAWGDPGSKLRGPGTDLRQGLFFLKWVIWG